MSSLDHMHGLGMWLFLFDDFGLRGARPRGVNSNKNLEATVWIAPCSQSFQRWGRSQLHKLEGDGEGPRLKLY